MNKYLPIQITTDQQQQFTRDGVVCLRELFDEDWIKLLTDGIEHNLLEPGKRH